MPKPDPTMTPRIVLCESDECGSRGAVRRPHEVSAQCVHPTAVKAPEKREGK